MTDAEGDDDEPGSGWAGTGMSRSAGRLLRASMPQSAGPGLWGGA